MRVKRSLVLALGLGSVAMVAVLSLTYPSSPKGAALAMREQAMELLGERIAKLRPKCKVLALANPFTRESGYFNEKSQFERAGLRGLRKGLGRRLPVTVVFPELRPEYQSVLVPSDLGTPLSFLVRPTSVDRLAEAHPECHVIVSLIGLPVGVDRLKVWQPEDPRCFALLLPDLRLLGPPTHAVAAFRREKLLAAVVEDANSGGPLVVTRDNVVDVLQHQPQALGY